MAGQGVEVHRFQTASRPMLHHCGKLINTSCFAVLLGLLVCLVGCQRTYQDFTPDLPKPRIDPNPIPLQMRPIKQYPPGVLTITGRLRWSGEIPDVPPIRGLISKPDGIRWGEMPNHFAPRIHLPTKGVADGVVYLKSAPSIVSQFSIATVEWSNLKVQLVDGDRTSRIGLVPVGTEIEMVSRDPVHHSLRARGASFFTIPFPEPNQPIVRKLGKPGHVELTSAAGYFWSAADLFVYEHPFYTKTDLEGRFELKNVPPGKYELVAWLRNWEVIDRERDPETGRIMRVKFAEPFQVTYPIQVVENQTTEAEIFIGP
jgi:hypothetical protein